MSPPTVSSPAFIAIQLTVVAADGHSHRVLVQAPGGSALTVPVGGRASTQIPGLKAGRYQLVVDGASRAALIIGGEPGP